MRFVQDYASPQAIERAHYGDTQFVAGRDVTLHPLIIVSPPFTGSTTIPIPAGSLGQDPNSLGIIVINGDDGSHSIGSSSAQVNGSPDHAPVKPYGFGSGHVSVDFYTFNALATDTSVTVNFSTGTTSVVAWLIYIPSIGQHMNGDSLTTRSSNQGSGGSSCTVAAPTFIAGDTVICFGIEQNDGNPGVQPAQGVPSFSTDQSLANRGFVNLEAAVVGWSLVAADKTATITAGGSGPPGVESLNLGVFVYAHV